MKSIRTYQIVCVVLLLIMGIFSFIQSGNHQNRGMQNKSFEDKDAISVIMNRKSVRDYSNRGIKKEDMETILRAAMAAPSGRDIRPWEFIVIDDREILDSMASELSTAQMLAKAPAAIVVCGDSIESFYWYLDCAAAVQNILLTAEALGLGAVWAASYPYEDRMEVVKKYTGIPDHILPLAIIPIGYPVGRPTPKNKFNPKKIHSNTWK